MPKVYLTNQDRICAKFVRWVYGEMKIRRIPQRVMADKMGISQQELSRRLRTPSIGYEDFVFFVNEFEPDDKELKELIRF